MKKKLTFIVLICTIICISTSCARKINGATPHRRDRNCGCENLSPAQPADYNMTIGLSSCETEIPLPPTVGNNNNLQGSCETEVPLPPIVGNGMVVMNRN